MHRCKSTMPSGGWPTPPADCDMFYSSTSGAAKRVLTDRGIAIVRVKIPPPFEKEHIVWDLWFSDHTDEEALTW